MAIQFPALSVRVTQDPRHDQGSLNMLPIGKYPHAIAAQAWFFCLKKEAVPPFGHGWQVSAVAVELDIQMSRTAKEMIYIDYWIGERQGFLCSVLKKNYGKSL